jgi:hypothetical protein
MRPVPGARLTLRKGGSARQCGPVRQPGEASHGRSRDVASNDGEAAAFTGDYFSHQGLTATAAGAGPALVSYIGARACPLLNAGSDFSVGDTMAVANDHRGFSERSLLKVIVKVIL